MTEGQQIVNGIVEKHVEMAFSYGDSTPKYIALTPDKLKKIIHDAIQDVETAVHEKILNVKDSD